MIQKLHFWKYIQWKRKHWLEKMLMIALFTISKAWKKVPSVHQWIRGLSSCGICVCTVHRHTHAHNFITQLGNSTIFSSMNRPWRLYAKWKKHTYHLYVKKTHKNSKKFLEKTRLGMLYQRLTIKKRGIEDDSQSLWTCCCEISK